MIGRTKWSLESLNKAYQKGFMTGLSGRDTDPCPFDEHMEDVLAAAWQSGKEDGLSEHNSKMKKAANNF